MDENERQLMTRLDRRNHRTSRDSHGLSTRDSISRSIDHAKRFKVSHTPITDDLLDYEYDVEQYTGPEDNIYAPRMGATISSYGQRVNEEMEATIASVVRKAETERATLVTTDAVQSIMEYGTRRYTITSEPPDSSDGLSGICQETSRTRLLASSDYLRLENLRMRSQDQSNPTGEYLWVQDSITLSALWKWIEEFTPLNVASVQFYLPPTLSTLGATQPHISWFLDSNSPERELLVSSHTDQSVRDTIVPCLCAIDCMFKNSTYWVMRIIYVFGCDFNDNTRSERLSLKKDIVGVQSHWKMEIDQPFELSRVQLGKLNKHEIGLLDKLPMNYNTFYFMDCPPKNEVTADAMRREGLLYGRRRRRRKRPKGKRRRKKR